jgi:spore coat polysaccharide biosynthesis protein SpsF
MGRPIIEYMIERIKLAKLPMKVVLCTTFLPEDDVLEEIAVSLGMSVYRGETSDILMRWLKAAERYKVDFFVSAEADDVFCDPECADKVVDSFLRSDADYIAYRGLPIGAGPTGVKVSALRRICELKLDSDTEGQQRYFTETGLFKVVYLTIDDSTLNHPEIRMTLDYLEDFEFFKAVIERLYTRNSVPTLRQIVDFLLSHASVMMMNQGAQEKYEANFKARYSAVRLRGSQ